MPTFDEVRGPIERLVYIILAWLGGKSLIMEDEQSNYATMILAAVAIIYGWFQNRRQGILKSAARVPSTVIVTSEELSGSMSKNLSNVLSVEDSQQKVTDAVKAVKAVQKEPVV